MKKSRVLPYLIQRVISFNEHHRLMSREEPVVVGFSGGPDSLFLLHALSTWKAPDTIIAAHLDHGWRTESGSEERFCAAVAHNLGVHFESDHLKNYYAHLKNRGSQEDLGRQARRLFFEKIATAHGATSIALAHHRDDQLETLFVRLVRGAGLDGVAGIQPRNGTYVRPLLGITKHEIITYLREHNMDYVIDPSNESPTHLRNRIRKTVIPTFAACDARALGNTVATLGHLAQANEFCELFAQEMLSKLTLHKDGATWLPLAELKELHPFVRNRVLALWLRATGIPFTPTEAFFSECERFLLHTSKSSHHSIGPSLKIVKKKGYAACTRS